MSENRILMITGSYPPDICGVGDYTQKIFEALSQSSVDVNIFYKTSWKIWSFFSYLKEIKSKKPSIIHLQYPTEGYGYSFLPLMLAIFLPATKLVITVHELSNRTRKAYIYTVLLILQAKTIVVTNEVESTHIKRNFLLKSKNVHIINIGSNIPRSEHALKSKLSRKTDVVYFGHIRPIKGIERFLALAEYFKESQVHVDFAIIGQNVPGYEDYFHSVKTEAEKLGIKLFLNNSPEMVADYISDCKIAYLPFPDGVSERRGSLITSAINGCAIVSTHSSNNNINLFFDEYCYLIDNDISAAQTIESLIIDIEGAKDAKKLYEIFSWTGIAKKHIELYKSL